MAWTKGCKLKLRSIRQKSFWMGKNMQNLRNIKKIIYSNLDRLFMLWRKGHTLISPAPWLTIRQKSFRMGKNMQNLRNIKKMIYSNLDRLFMLSRKGHTLISPAPWLTFNILSAMSRSHFFSHNLLLPLRSWFIGTPLDTIRLHPFIHDPFTFF